MDAILWLIAAIALAGTAGFCLSKSNQPKWLGDTLRIIAILTTGHTAAQYFSNMYTGLTVMLIGALSYICGIVIGKNTGRAKRSTDERAQ